MNKTRNAIQVANQIRAVVPDNKKQCITDLINHDLIYKAPEQVLLSFQKLTECLDLNDIVHDRGLDFDWQFKATSILSEISVITQENRKL